MRYLCVNEKKLRKYATKSLRVKNPTPFFQNNETGDAKLYFFRKWGVERSAIQILDDKAEALCSLPKCFQYATEGFFVLYLATIITWVTSVPHLADYTPNPVKHTSAYGRTRLAIGGFPFQSPGTDPGRWEGDLIETILHLQRRDAAGKHSNKRTCSGTDLTIPGT